MQFPNYCQTRGDRLAHALWLVGQGGGFERADLALLIDAEFPETVPEAPATSPLEEAINVITAVLHRGDPQLSNPRHRATIIAQSLRAAGLIRG